MSQYWHPGGWFHRIDAHELCYVRPGMRESGTALSSEEVVISIPLFDSDIPGLISVLEKAGYIHPRLDERLRTEDLKITHRLLDLLERKTDDGRQR